MERPAGVYRLWAEDRTLLYVGSSYYPQGRCGGHQTKPWWPDVASRTEEWHESRVDAFRAELAAIVAEKSVHNVVGTGRETEAMRERTAANRDRGRVQAEAYRLERQVRDEAYEMGANSREAYRLANQAVIDFLDASGLFPAYVARLRDQQRPDWVTNPAP